MISQAELLRILDTDLITCSSFAHSFHSKESPLYMRHVGTSFQGLGSGSTSSTYCDSELVPSPSWVQIPSFVWLGEMECKGLLLQRIVKEVAFHEMESWFYLIHLDKYECETLIYPQFHVRPLISLSRQWVRGEMVKWYQKCSRYQPNKECGI